MTRNEESPLEVRRGERGMTQEKLATLTGVPQSTISAIEGGTRVLTINLAEKLSRAFADLDPLLFALEHVRWLESDLPLQTCTAKAKSDLTTFREAGVNTNNLGNRELVFNAIKGVVKVTNVVDCGGGVEFYISPGILVNKDRQAATLKAQLRVNELRAQLGKGKGAVIEDTGLTTAQQKVEQVEPAPSILLAKPKGGKGK